MTPSILSIAGSDSSSGAGIQADIKASFALGTHCSTVITAITSQNTQGVEKVTYVQPTDVESQLMAVIKDLNITAIKIGMVGSAKNIQVISKCIQIARPEHIVIDPILVSTSGSPLLEAYAKDSFINELLPLASIITPNLAEASEILNSMRIKCSEAKNLEQMEEQAKALVKRLGIKSALVTGGHLDSAHTGENLTSKDFEDSNLNSTKMLSDVLATTSNSAYEVETLKVQVFSHPTINSENTHGTGCNLSTALCSYLCQGYKLEVAVEKAINFVSSAIENGKDQNVGHGQGPLVPVSKL